MKFNVIPQDTFDALQVEAGVLLRNFDPDNPAAPAPADVITATTGGIKPSCIPTLTDFFEDVDNAPTNTKEGKRVTGWDCKLETTAIGTSPEVIRLALGIADIDPNNSAHVIPRADIEQSDFRDLWFVGDKANGGCVAIKLSNALSTGGFSLQTSKAGKGQIALSITGHVSINDQKKVPMEFWSADPETEQTGTEETNTGA